MWRLQFPTAPSYRVALLQRKPKKKRSKVLVDVTGIEPVTPCLQSTRVFSLASIHYA
jgi:hypothetical protein